MSKSIEELFRDAPEGATHFLPARSEDHTDVWFKIVDGYVVSAGYTGRDEWAHEYTKDCQPSTDMSRLISRKDDEIKPWSGPEDGLPPVGETCERRFDDLEDSSWQQITVIAYGNRKVFYSDKNGDEWSHHTSELEFRAIKTQEQIARDQRESAIRELMDIAQVDCRVTAARLVDAGFKREVV